MTTTAEILQKARDLISDEKNWTQGDYSKDADGNVTLPDDPGAVCFCAIGAVHKAGEFDMNRRLPVAIIDLLLLGEIEEGASVTEKEGAITDFNDIHTHAEVLDLFDRAIKRAVASEGAA